MKNGILCLTFLALSISAHAHTDEQQRQEMQLNVSEAYSQCAAYYEISARIPSQANGPGADDDKAMKRASLALAIAMATDIVGKRKAKPLAHANFDEAIETMYNLPNSSREKFEKFIVQYRRDCRMAINDPPSVADLMLASNTTQRSPSSQIVMPPNLTVEAILKYEKPTTTMRDPRHCPEPAETINIPLDDVLVDGSMICSQHRDGACDSERLWMSYRQFIAQLHPDFELISYSKTLSTTFKDGQRQSKRSINACLTTQ